MKLVTQAADIFDELAPLEEHEQKKFKVECTPTIDAFVRGLEMIIALWDVEEVCKELPLPKYGARDVEAFSLMLNRKDYKTNIFEYDAGVWLNALIQHCPDEEITIHTYHLSEPLGGIGEGHKGKYLIVNGDVGKWCGLQMKRGIIHVKGNVVPQVGYEMQGGKIVVEGNAGNFVGDQMKGGEIHLNGSYERISDRIKGGDIYHKGKCIVKDGKIL